MADACKKDRLPPPDWNPDSKTYHDWRFQVNLWNQACEMAKVKKAERGYKLYDRLKDITSKNVGEKVTIAVQVGEIDIFSENAVNEIIAVLDKSFKSDDLTLMHRSWSSFINLKRGADESMDSYIDTFERKVSELKRDGIDLPEKVLAMQLLDAANIDAKDAQMVLTGVDYQRPDEMFSQMKRAIRKFFGEQVGFGKPAKPDPTPDIKVEDANQSSTDNRKRFYQGNRGSRGRGGRSNRGLNRGSRNNQRSQRKTNPLDEEGNPRACHICKSIFHFAGKNGENCPDSYENAQIADAEEEVNEVSDIILEEVMFTELGYCGLLDCCCTANVMGEKWKDGFFDKMSLQDKKKVTKLKGGTGFKFGGSKTVYSTAKYIFPCVIDGKDTRIMADVVDRDIPLLISKKEMKGRAFRLDLEHDILELNGKQIQLQTSPAGHYKLP